MPFFFLLPIIVAIVVFVNALAFALQKRRQRQEKRR